MDYEMVVLDRADHVATLTLNRPEVLNALNRPLTRDFHAALDEVAADDDIWVLIITGTGRGFCSGADVSQMAGGGGTPQEGPAPRAVTQLGLHIRELPQPVIAAVNGVAAGAGLSVTLATDVRIASEAARFSCIFVKRSLVPDTGASYLLPKLVGPGIAAEMALTGKVYDAPWALQAGLVNRVVPADALLEEANALAREMLTNPPLALRAVKTSLYAGDVPLSDALAWESVGNAATSGTEDRREANRSFVERRTPVFKGR